MTLLRTAGLLGAVPVVAALLMGSSAGTEDAEWALWLASLAGFSLHVATETARSTRRLVLHGLGGPAATIVLSVAGIVFLLSLLVHLGTGLALRISLLLASLQILSCRLAPSRRPLGVGFSDWLVLSLGWLCVAAYLWWLPSETAARLSGFQAVSLIALVLAVGFCVSIADDALPDRSRARRVASLSATIVFAAVALIESFRTDLMASETFFHHWGVYVSAILQLRHGGWLLWDIPSQYGFLDILIASLLPTASAWQSLYVLNSALLFIQTGLLFLVLRTAFPSLGGTILSGCLALGATFLIPGLATEMTGPQNFPSVSAMRFIWVYATIYWLIRRKGLAVRSSARTSLDIGLWLLAFAWSFESAVYCAFIWLGVYLAHLFSRPTAASLVMVMRDAAAKLGATAALIIAVALYYEIRLGVWPDFAMFGEHARAFQQGFYALPLALNGPVWAFAFVFLVAGLLVASRAALSDLSLPLAACFGLAGVSTYFVSRSHPNNATNLFPVIVLCVATLVASCTPAPRWRARLALWFSPLIAGPLLAVLLTTDKLEAHVKGLAHATTFDIESRLPAVPSEVESLLHEAGCLPETALVGLYDPGWSLIGRSGGALFVNPWLPVAPLAGTIMLPLDRMKTFVIRRTSRVPGCGLVIDRPDFAHQYKSEFFEAAGLRAERRSRNGAFESTLWCSS